MTLSTLYPGNNETIVYQGHVGFLVSTVPFSWARAAIMTAITWVTLFFWTQQVTPAAETCSSSENLPTCFLALIRGNLPDHDPDHDDNAYTIKKRFEEGQYLFWGRVSNY